MFTENKLLLKDGIVHMCCLENKIVAEFLTWNPEPWLIAFSSEKFCFLHMEIQDRTSVKTIRKKDSEASHRGRIKVQIQL